MKKNVEPQLRRLLRKTSGLDIIVLLLSVIFIFALFGTYKWFAFEASALHHLLPGTWLGALYPTLGVQGLSYALGAVENITLLALIAGFFRPAVGAAGALMVAGTGIVTLSLLPQLGRIGSLIIKDVLLIGAGLVLLRHDLRRTLINRRAKQLSSVDKPRSSDALSAGGNPELRSSKYLWPTNMVPPRVLGERQGSRLLGGDHSPLLFSALPGK